MDLNEYMSEDISVFGIDENPFNRQNYHPRYRNPNIVDQLYDKKLEMSQYTEFNFPVDLSKNRVLKGGIHKESIISSIRKIMNEGIIGEELTNTIMSRFDKDILASLGDEVKELMNNEYGILGHLYFDASLYKDYKEALLKFHDRRRVSSVYPQYLKMKANCPGCNHDEEKRCRKFQMPLKDKYDYGWDEVKPLIQRLLQSRLSPTILSHIIFSSNDQKEILKAAVLFKSDNNKVRESGVYDYGEASIEKRESSSNDEMVGKVKEALLQKIRISSIKKRMIGKLIPNSMEFDNIIKSAIKSSDVVNASVFEDCQQGLIDYANKILKKSECDDCKFYRIDSCARNGKLFDDVKIAKDTSAIDDSNKMQDYLNSTFSNQELNEIDFYVDNLPSLDHKIFDN